MKKQFTTPSIRVLKRINKLKKFLFEETSNEPNNHFITCLIFCYFADQNGVFPLSFFDYISRFREDPKRLQQEFEQIFRLLNTPEKDRKKELSGFLSQVPYLDLPLFQTPVSIPLFSDRSIDLLFEIYSNFDFKSLTPVIFCSSFEDNINYTAKHLKGTYYTSEHIIHRVIDPLFIESLSEELSELLKIEDKEKLRNFIKKLSKIKILDPASGSGNFLIESYISLRELENTALIKLKELDENDLHIKISPNQFYGIEINPLAQDFTESAFFLAQKQMLKKLEDALNLSVLDQDEIPNIYIGNALTTDWNTVISNKECNYIIGNPPFLGARLMDQIQKRDLLSNFDETWKNTGNFDYSAGWFKKAADYMKDTEVETAFINTSSLFQGESVLIFWKPLIESGLKINFAYPTFRWQTKSDIKSQVFCSVAGISYKEKPKRLYNENGLVKIVDHINCYLAPGDDVFIQSRTQPIISSPSIRIGNKPVDNGNYLFSREEMEKFIKKEPESRKYFRPWYGSTEFVKNQPRFCLWLGEAEDKDLIGLPEIKERIEAVRTFRQNSRSIVTRRIADQPKNFHVENIPNQPFLLIPRVCTAKREYVPIGFMDPENLCSDSVYLIQNTGLYEFGVLTSSAHMHWLKRVGGRYGIGYRYSKDLVYNNFPWPDSNEEDKLKIKKTASQILKIRQKYSDTPFNDLYNPEKMPDDLRKAHLENDAAVLQAYQLQLKDSEDIILEKLFNRYQKIIENI